MRDSPKRNSPKRGPTRAENAAKRPYNSFKREFEAADTNARIVAAASRHLRSPHGLKHLSLEAVAKEAGVSRLTVYNQFGSRRGLFEAVFDDRARRGGLQHIPAAMDEPDPRMALQRVVAIFCQFWYFNRKLLGHILAAGVADPQLEQSMRARNERRRKLLAVLVNRLNDAGAVPTANLEETVDVLFVLTSHAVFAGLASSGRSVETVCRLVQQLATDVVNRMGMPSASV
jgi:AcrR family transcriptional regulator